MTRLDGGYMLRWQRRLASQPWGPLRVLRLAPSSEEPMSNLTITVSRWDQPHPLVGLRVYVAWGTPGSRHGRVLISRTWPEEATTTAHQVLRHAAEEILRALDESGL